MHFLLLFITALRRHFKLRKNILSYCQFGELNMMILDPDGTAIHAVLVHGLGLDFIFIALAILWLSDCVM